MMVKVSTKKTKGQVYTPKYIVNNILDLSGYVDSATLDKHVMDNSCGDGAFLVEIVERYIKSAILYGKNKEIIKTELEKYIHGIEKDPTEHKKCLVAVNGTACKYDINNVNWDIICADALDVKYYNGKMDYVFGNPPYVRIHNLLDNFEKVKAYKFSQSGMTDLYIVFYEIGLNMLNKNGVLGYISPSSLFNSVACKDLRKFLVQNNKIRKVVDLKHNQVFDATTYTTIMVLSNSDDSRNTEYFEYDIKSKQPYFVDNLSSENYYIDGKFYFSSKEKLNTLKKILNTKIYGNNVCVKNGFATLSDDIFIGEFDFKKDTISVIKGSTGEQKSCIFPYKNGKRVAISDLSCEVEKYLTEHKDILSKRSLAKDTSWYEFGRSQGINDVYKNKYAINSIIKDVESIRLTPCPEGVGVYSGLYIMTKLSEEELKGIILNQKFIEYIKLLGKYKNSGYYAFSSNELEKYIGYESKCEEQKNEQLGLFTSY